MRGITDTPASFLVIKAYELCGRLMLAVGNRSTEASINLPHNTYERIRMSYKHMQFLKKYIMVGVLLLILIVFSSMSKRFLTPSNINGTLLANTPSAFLALGGMFILITGEFDLSLGYNLCFCMIVGAFAAYRGAGLIPTLLLMLAAGTLVGFLNGLLVVKLQISSFIVTLSLGLALSGLSQALSGGGVIYISEPKMLMNFARAQIGKNGIGVCVVVFLIFALFMHLMLTRSKFGRHLYAVGVSRKISFMAGIKVDRVRILAFTFAGFMASMGGVVLLGQLGAASSSYGTSMLLPAYATVFLSNTAFKPGYINMPGVILSILLVQFGSNGIQIVGAPTWGEYMFEGFVLCFSMWLSTKFRATDEKKAQIDAAKKAEERG